MDKFKPREIQIILKLADDEGHPNWELAKYLGVNEGNSSREMKSLREKGMIRKGETRNTTNPDSTHKNQQENPFFLVRDIPVDFKPEDIEHPLILASILLDPISSKFKNNLSLPTNQILAEFHETHKLSESFSKALVEDFNRLIQGPNIYFENYFSNIILREKTRKFAGGHRHVDLKLLNRLLIEDAFPHQLSKASDIQAYSGFIRYLTRNEKYKELSCFLGSNYVNNIIKEDGLLPVYKIIKKDLVRSEFRSSISKSILESLAVGEQFRDIFNISRKFILHYFSRFTKNESPLDVTDEMRIKYSDYFPWFKLEIRSRYQDLERIQLLREYKKLYFYSDRDLGGGMLEKMAYAVEEWDDLKIEILKNFDPIYAVRFYRENILEIFKDLYDALYKLTAISSGLKDFMQHDAYLSPFTSYPVNNMEDLLFILPFNRIYDDVYLLTKADVDILIKRAQTAYENFVDLLFDNYRLEYYFCVVHNEPVRRIRLDELAMETRLYILYWNTSILRFDLVVQELKSIFDEESPQCHLKIKVIYFNIYNLKDAKRLLIPEETRLIMRIGTTPLFRKKIKSEENIEDPTRYLKSSNYFSDNAKEKEIWLTYEKILSSLKDKLTEAKWL